MKDKQSALHKIIKHIPTKQIKKMSKYLSTKKITALFMENWYELIRSPKLFAVLIAVTWLIVNMVIPYMDTAKLFDEPYNILEPYLIMFNVIRCMIVIPVAYLLWICDYPKAGNENMFVIARMGKRNWLIGQLLFMMSAGIIYLAVVFGLSCLISQKNAFIFDGYSGFVQRLSTNYADYAQVNGIGIAIRDTIYCHFRPYMAVASNVGFMLLYMLWSGLIQTIFTLKHKKLWGVAINLALLFVGFVTSFFDWKIQWIFPYGNILLENHYEYAFSKPIVWLEYSIGYFVVGSVILYIIAIQELKKFSFYGLEGE